jgi:hypothetical protein
VEIADPAAALKIHTFLSNVYRWAGQMLPDAADCASGSTSSKSYRASARQGTWCPMLLPRERVGVRQPRSCLAAANSASATTMTFMIAVATNTMCQLN